MRTDRVTTLAVGVTAGVAAYAVLASGALTGGGGRLVDAAHDLVRVPSAAAEELPGFDGCEQLRRWYVRTALPKVGPWGLGGPPVTYAMGVASPRSATSATEGTSAADATDPVGSSDTGTNVQEPGIDESDVAKTDGRLVVRFSGRLLVVTDVSRARPRELSRTTLPGPLLGRPELLLHDDRVVVVGDELTTSYRGGPIVDREDLGTRFLPPPALGSRAHVLSLDLGDPSAPRVTSDRSVDGGVVSTRAYPDGTVRVVVTAGYPPLDFVQPNRDRSPREATRLNRRILQNAPVGAWLPGVRTGTGPERPLLDCADVRHPVRPSGFGTLSVLTFPVDEPASLDTTGVTAAGDLVYSSARRLYVATSADHDTTVHAFALDGPRTSYVGSGSVPGTVRDRWSFSEYDGHLRVATTLGQDWQPRENAVVVLAERHGRLVRTGRVDGLGRDEQIKSVRWFGDLAVVVTFRQTDPLYTLDLSDAARPRVVGELRIPGYSAYLHPVGDDLLVGLGHDATSGGTDLGAQAATFDLHDPADVRRAGSLGFGQQTGLAAERDPRTVTYLPRQRTLVTTVEDWAGSGSRFVALRVSRAGALAETASWPARPGTDGRVLPLGDGRVALVDGDLRVVRVG